MCLDGEGAKEELKYESKLSFKLLLQQKQRGLELVLLLLFCFYLRHLVTLGIFFHVYDLTRASLKQKNRIIKVGKVLR